MNGAFDAIYWAASFMIIGAIRQALFSSIGPMAIY